MIKATKFSLVIPCFNEELAIPIFLVELNQFEMDFTKYFVETDLNIIFIDNNSTDQSNYLLNQCVSGRKNRTLLKCKNQGYGAALKFGFSADVADFYAFIDIDQTYPLLDFITGLDYMLNHSNVDMLMTNRFSDLSKMPLLRKFGNQFFAKIVNFLFTKNLVDVCSGQRIIRKNKMTDVINLNENGLNFSIELTCTALKESWTVFYLPILYKDRIGVSKLSIIKDGLQFLITVFRVKFLK